MSNPAVFLSEERIKEITELLKDAFGKDLEQNPDALTDDPSGTPHLMDELAKLQRGGELEPLKTLYPRMFGRRPQ